MDPSESDFLSNPFLPPPVLLEPEREPRQLGNLFWLKLWTALQTTICFVALGWSTVSIYSIVWMGPCLAAAGIAVAITAYRKRFPVGVLFGLSAPAFALFIFVLINVLEWSPGDAEKPVPAMGLAYACMTFAAGLVVHFQIQRRQRESV